MKHKFTPLALAALMLGVLAMGSLTSCKKDPTVENNPPVRELSAATFTLSAVETRGTKHASFDWTVSKDGVTDSVSEELNEMTVTPRNNIVFTVVPDGNAADFPGFNVWSTNVNAVRVENVTSNEFKLKYVGDGETTIEVWNGAGSTEVKYTFKVVSRASIPIKGFLVRVDDEEVLVPFVNFFDYDEMKKYPICEFPYLEEIRDVPDAETWARHTAEERGVKKFTFLHAVPENTTWRFLLDSDFGNSYFTRLYFPDEAYSIEAEFGEYASGFTDDGAIVSLENGTDVSFFNGKFFRHGVYFNFRGEIVETGFGFNVTDYPARGGTIEHFTSGAKTIMLYGKVEE